MNNLATDTVSSKTKFSSKIGLYFGSFNPIHIGHLAIANYLVEFTEIDQLWFVVSPQNPHKKKANLLDNYWRLEMVHRAIGKDYRFRASSIEFNLPIPSYTVDTLAYLNDRFPKKEFKLIMGSDNLENFHKWKNYEIIIENYGVIVYTRPGFNKSKVKFHKNIWLVENVPQMEISSSFIRQAIKDGKDVQYFMPPESWKYLEEMNFYR